LGGAFFDFAALNPASIVDAYGGNVKKTAGVASLEEATRSVWHPQADGELAGFARGDFKGAVCLQLSSRQKSRDGRNEIGHAHLPEKL